MWRILLVCLVVLAVGCSQPVGSTSPSLKLGTLSEPEQKAVDAARRLLEQKGLAWGQPDSIKLSSDGKEYWITYPTPQSEQKTLGPRSVTVHATTWEAKLVMRD